MCVREDQHRTRAQQNYSVLHVHLTTRGDRCSCADASPIGTTVLQIREIPARPVDFEGALCLFAVVDGVGESTICKRLEAYGRIVKYEAAEGSTPAIVRFSDHNAALAAKRAAPELRGLCGAIDTLYNERSYDGRKGEEGREDDDGRGWCALAPRADAAAPVHTRLPPQPAS